MDSNDVVKAYKSDYDGVYRWAIPDGEPKPADARIKSGKYIKNKDK